MFVPLLKIVNNQEQPGGKQQKRVHICRIKNESFYIATQCPLNRANTYTSSYQFMDQGKWFKKV